MKTEKLTYIKRFSVYRIVEHHVNAIVFALLVITGLSQKFHDSAFSQWIIITLGGVDNINHPPLYRDRVRNAPGCPYFLCRCRGYLQKMAAVHGC